MIFLNFFIILQAWIFYVFTLKSSAANPQLDTDLKNLNKRLKPIVTKIINQDREGFLKIAIFQEKAFKTALKYRYDEIQDEIQKRIIHIFLNFGWKSMNDNEFIKMNQICETGRTLFRSVRKTFHNDVNKYCIVSAEQDLKMQKDWKYWSEELSPNATEQLDSLIDMKHEIAKITNQMHSLGCNDTVSFWKFYLDYNKQYSEEHMKKIWETELQLPYLEFMLFMRRNLYELFNIYNGIQYRDEPMPAYIYDIIYNSFSYGGVEDGEIGSHSPALRHRKNNVFKIMNSILHSRNMTILMIVVEIQQYFESLGFDVLNDYFWQKSVTTTLTDTSKNYIVKIHYDGYDKYWIEIVAYVSVLVYYKIAEEMLFIHQYRLMEQKNHLPIFWLPETNVHSTTGNMIKAMLSTFLSESYWTGEKVYTKNSIEHLKMTALGIFTKVATSVVMNTWELDILANNISSENRYCELWNRRLKYENVVPLTITNEYFDAHKNIDFYIRNSLLFGNAEYDDSFVSSILMYQIQAHLCEQAGQYNFDNPLQYSLYNCNLKGNKKVGALIKEVLGYGSLKTWHEILDMITGTKNTQLSAKGLLGYFAPLFEEIRKTKHYQRPISRAKMLKRWGDFCKK